MAKQSEIHSHIEPRNVRPVAMDAADAKDFGALAAIGINLPQSFVADAASWAMDDQQGLVTTASITTPIQFLQNWLPGFVKTQTAARKIDELIGITTTGSIEDEEIVQGVLEPVGNAVPYGDYTNVPLSDWNTNFERRTVVRFEKGFKVGYLEDLRAARIRISTAAEKRNAAALALEVQRNAVGFFGYNNGANRTYGFLNDPSLPGYVTVATGAASSTLWANKTALEIIKDIRVAAAALQTQSQDLINPEDMPTTLALATSIYQYLSTPTEFGYSVRKWIDETYNGKMRVVSAPQLNQANGGSNVFYLYAENMDDGSSDGGATFLQVVPAKFQAIGVEKQAKAYVEDYSNATAGVMVKRPYAIVRYSGA